jgi:hypothetical protein
MNNILSQLSNESLEELLNEIHTEFLKRREIPEEAMISVCGKNDCKCFFTNRGELKGSPTFNDCQLVVWKLDGEEHEIRKQLYDAIKPFSAVGKIFVNANAGFANMTFKNHTIATNAQYKLDENGYSVNFYCTNMKELK